MLAVSREWIRGAVRFGVRTNFTVFATHYQDIDFTVVSTGFVPGYPEEEFTEIGTVTHPIADILAARYEDEALPGEGRTDL